MRSTIQIRFLNSTVGTVKFIKSLYLKHSKWDITNSNKITNVELTDKDEENIKNEVRKLKLRFKLIRNKKEKKKQQLDELLDVDINTEKNVSRQNLMPFGQYSNSQGKLNKDIVVNTTRIST